MNRTQVEYWLTTNKDFLSIMAIEQKIGCPRDTLRKFLSGKQGLPDKWLVPLTAFIDDFTTIETGGVISFGSKTENNRRRESQFLRLPPELRVKWFFSSFDDGTVSGRQKKGNLTLKKTA